MILSVANRTSGMNAIDWYNNNLSTSLMRKSKVDNADRDIFNAVYWQFTDERS